MAWQDRWTPEVMREKVRALLFDEGLSTRAAAARLGHDVTKNMIIRIRQTLMGKTRSTVTFPDSVWPSTPKSRGERLSDAPEVPVHLLRAREGQCRAPLWPDFLRSIEKVTTAEHMLCGKRAKDGSSYCADHHEVFYPAALQKRVLKPKKQEAPDNTRHFR